MRVGFSTIYSFRPHVEHAYFLSNLLKKAGHESFFLTCNADLPTCYSRELRDQATWRTCTQCKAGGFRSFTTENVDSIGDYANYTELVPSEWAASTASTLGRFESDADYKSKHFESLVGRIHPVVQVSYHAARAWIKERQLDAVCVFNGRIDATRGIMEAAQSLGVRVVSLERTWFGDGLQLYPEESCLGLTNVHRLMALWRDKPLTEKQALLAASYAARRFLRKNGNEWRAYNVNAMASSWPVTNANRRILLIPSSRNEVWGHPDWISGWPDATDAYDALIDHLGLKPNELVLRCHPNWGEKIGRIGGEYSERHYTNWANKRGVHVIPSGDSTSTLDLIQQCDAIVVSNGSAALEAGFLGKQVISIAPSVYQYAGFRDSAMSPSELSMLRLHESLHNSERLAAIEQITRFTLRFAYTMVHRIPQYTNFVRAETTTRFRYDHSADPQRFIDLLRTGVLKTDDESYASEKTEEDAVLGIIAKRDWQSILNSVKAATLPDGIVQRRLVFRPLDTVRKWMPIGDR
jgi:hypothetical protein